jgi:pyruvate-formate lyase-activating enzyme
MGDAPFVGALLSACDCKFNCHNCFNQHIKNIPTISEDSEIILSKVQKNIFNKGIILAGLEWTLQEDEMYELCKQAKVRGLKTIVFTGNTFEYFKNKDLTYYDYLKCGQYKEELKTANHIEYGVALASSNQHIYIKGTDY